MGVFVDSRKGEIKYEKWEVVGGRGSLPDQGGTYRELTLARKKASTSSNIIMKEEKIRDNGKGF